MWPGINRMWAASAPVVPQGIIPVPDGDETRSAALIDIRLCATLLLVIIAAVIIIVVPPSTWPQVVGTPAVWPLLVTAVLSVVRLSRRSHIRIVRLRRS
ncbi:hypothetical protein ACFXJO_04520 [Streptomyces lavendulae]|uniref:hypothetical protein n=1 Tax=Streptomyces lavendulae TaxID=1914 RepID=UPI0036A1CFD2